MTKNTFYHGLDGRSLLFVLCSALLLFLIPPACTCRYVDCEGNELLSVRFFSQSDSSELFATGALPYDSLTIQALYPSGAAPWDYRFTDFFDTNYDVAIELKPDLKGYIFHFGTGSSDTLFVQMLQTTDSPCCPGVLLLDHAVFRGDTVQVQGTSNLRFYF